MTVGTGNFAELLWPGIATIWGEQYNDYPTMWTRFFTTRTSDKAFEKAQGVTGLGLASVKDQGDEIPYADPLQGFQKEFVNVTYAQGCTVTREMFEDSQYDYINRLPAMIAKSGRQTQETLAFNHINRATNTAFPTADGLPLASTAHLFVTGGTFSNRPTTGVDLSQTGIEDAYTAIRDFVDDHGLKIYIQPKSILLPTALEWTGKKIFKTEKEVGTANNDMNPIANSIEQIVSPYLTDSDAWTVVTDCDDGFIWYWRRQVEMLRDNEFDTQNLKFAQTWRSSSGVINVRCAYHSPGA
jgi:hypothetical protein